MATVSMSKNRNHRISNTASHGLTQNRNTFQRRGEQKVFPSAQIQQHACSPRPVPKTTNAPHNTHQATTIEYTFFAAPHAHKQQNKRGRRRPSPHCGTRRETARPRYCTVHVPNTPQIDQIDQNRLTIGAPHTGRLPLEQQA